MIFRGLFLPRLRLYPACFILFRADDSASLRLQELNCLYQASTVERDRFAELVQVLEKR